MTRPAGSGSLGDLVGELAVQLGSASEARWIAADAAGIPDRGLPTVLDRPAGFAVAARAADLCRRRRAGEPLQYVLGRWAFRSLELAVDPRVLIPRPETEQVVEVALRELGRLPAGTGATGEEAARRSPVVVDAGTGSGAIALSIAVEAGAARPDGLEVWATDSSPDALEVAAANRRAVSGRLPPGTAVHLQRGDWLLGLPPRLAGQVALVVANPPYLSEAEWADLDPSVRDHEPRRALVAGPTGLEAYRVLFAQIGAWVAPDAAVVVEIAPHQADALGELARRAGAAEVAVHPDLSGRDRAVVARFRRG